MVDWASETSFHSFTGGFCRKLKLKLKATDTDNTESYPYQFRKKKQNDCYSASILKHDPNTKGGGGGGSEMHKQTYILIQSCMHIHVLMQY